MANRRADKRRLYDRRRTQIDEIKVARGCIDCGYNLAPEALHFDHRNPDDKEFGLGGNIFLSWERQLIEIAKCDVRCANCHAIRTKAYGHYMKGR